MTNGNALVSMKTAACTSLFLACAIQSASAQDFGGDVYDVVDVAFHHSNMQRTTLYGTALDTVLHTRVAVLDDQDRLFFATVEPQSFGLYVLDTDGVIYPIIKTNRRGYRDGPAGSALFRTGSGAYTRYVDLAVDKNPLNSTYGSIYVADGLNGAIRRVYRDGFNKWQVETYAGGGLVPMAVEDQPYDATDVAFGGAVASVAVDRDGVVWTAPNKKIVKIVPGTPPQAVRISLPATIDTSKELNNVVDLETDDSGNLYACARYLCNCYWFFNPSTKAFWKTAKSNSNFQDGHYSDVHFAQPMIVVPSPDGSVVYLGGEDSPHTNVRKLDTTTMRVSTLMKDGTWVEASSQADRDWASGSPYAVDSKGVLWFGTALLHGYPMRKLVPASNP